jgi:hypothetical protein
VNTDTTAAERRAKAICVNYHKNKRFKKLDEVVFASDVVGEMEPPGLCMGPFKDLWLRTIQASCPYH